MPQDPLASLHPLRSVGAQLRETLRVHARPEREARDLLARVHLPDPDAALARFPHQFSGGQRQRIAIALALCSGPRYLIADEPTSALDARIAREVLDLLDALRREDGLGLMLISHDLPLVGAYADEVLVLRRGDVIERGPTRAVFDAPSQDYTRELIAAEQIPPSPLRDAGPLLQRGQRAASSLSSEGLRVDAGVAVASSPLAVPSDAVMPSDAESSPLCKRERAAAQQSTGHLPLLRGESLTMRYPRAPAPALDNVDLVLHRGEGLALLGESGSGKSTLGRALLRLLRGAQGGCGWTASTSPRSAAPALRALRGRIGVVFQDPYASLDPRMRVGDIVSEPLRIHGDGKAASRAAKARELLAAVGLDPAMVDRWPHQFSGGQRQRIAIARALARDRIFWSATKRSPRSMRTIGAASSNCCHRSSANAGSRCCSSPTICPQRPLSPSASRYSKRGGSWNSATPPTCSARRSIRIRGRWWRRESCSGRRAGPGPAIAM